MDLVFQFQLSIYALIVLAMLILKIYYREEIYSYSSRLFRALLISAGVVLILEFLSWAFDGRPGNFNHLMNYLFNYLLFVSSTIVPGFWLSYLHFKIYGNINTVRKLYWFQFPMLISFVIATINIFVPIVFKVPVATNLFERLPFIAINFVMAYLLVFYSVFIAIKERSKIKNAVFVTVVIFVILPLIASIVQALNYGLIIMYPILALSTIVVYLFLETQSASKDYLTGAYSRSRFDEFVARKTASNEEFCVVMLDLDDYKIFNDEHGHTVGDRILIQYVNQAKQVFGDQSLVARYGGDEFVVVIPGRNVEELMRLNGQLKDAIKHSKDPIFSQLRYSFGHSCRTKENQYTYDNLLIEADKVMYKNKAINKNFQRRKEDKDFINETGE